MRAVSLWKLVGQSVTRNRRGILFSIFGVAVGVGALVFFVGLGLGVGRVVREKIFPLDSSLVDVVPPTVSLGTLLGGGKLDQSAVDRLTALPQVSATYRKMNIRVPGVTVYNGDFFGSKLRMGIDILGVGVDPDLINQDVKAGEFKDMGEGAPIPVVVSARLLEIYNKSFAPARKLPALSPTMILGFTFPVEFNRSFVAVSGPGPTRQAQLQVVGVSDRALLAGVTVPLSVAMRINQSFSADAATFTGVAVLARDPSAVPRIIEEVKRMGLQVDDQERRLAENAGAAVMITTSAMALLSVLICLLAAVNIAHALSASVRSRSREIGVMRAVGASKGDVRNLILAEASVMGALGGAVGTLGSVLLAVAIDQAARAYLPAFPFKPDSFFRFPPLLILGGVAIGLGAALAGAYFPSRTAASLDPARTLAG